MKCTTIEKDLAALKDMTPQRLRQRYAELYGEPSRSGNKQWLIRRCAWRTATAEIIVPKAMILTVSWSGMGETEDPNYELMSLSVDGGLVGSAHAPGGNLGCNGGMGPVVSNPAPPQQVTLQPGAHTLFIDATTNDPLYHFGAWYRFDLTFEEAP
ncbi:MAG: DUF2924 domain-containing protein [Rhodopirellula sp.]|nr:DUF2924 domain-containing protein [Rhodopirellula sp.]